MGKKADSPLNENTKCWVITEGMAGTENQCLGVAEALGLRPSVKRIRLREPWKTLSPTLGFEQWWSFNPEFYPPWPDILITSGRKSIAASRFIKKASGGKTFTLQIQSPRIDSTNFDMVAVPFHDDYRGKNVIVTIGAPNRITQTKLAQAQKQFQKLAKYKNPVLAVMIGGNSKTHTMSEPRAHALIQELKKTKASLLVTISRRTPNTIKEMLEKQLKGKNIYLWDGSDENPYFAFLAYADAVLVTSDSASMISEAATTGKPVYKFDLEGSSEKFDRFYKKLKALEILRDFKGDIEKWEYTPLNDAEKIAQAVRTAFEKRGKPED